MDNSTYKIKTINEIRKRNVTVTGFNRIKNAIEYNLKLNLEKENVSFLRGITHKFNKSLFDQWRCIT
jgi:hypothetical protein